MGVFWHAAVLKKQNRVDVQEVLGQLAVGENEFGLELDECIVHECEAGILIGVNDFCLAFEGLAKALSEKLDGPVLVCDIYDDDFWDYFLYKEGRELDKFMTVPDCLEEIAEEEWDHWRGNAALLSQEFGCSEEAVSEYLRFWGEEDGWDAWEVVDFLAALGFELPEADAEDDVDLECQSDLNEEVEQWEAPCAEEPNKDARSFLRKTSHAKIPVNLMADVKVDPKLTMWVRVCEEGVMKQFLGSTLTSEQIVQYMDETLNGRYTYFAADFLLQGEGIYVKRLKKKVYRPYHSTLVLHQGSGNMACFFFAGDSLCCYELLGNFDAYYEVYLGEKEAYQTLPVGNVELTQSLVFHERSGIDRALKMLFSDLENADKWLSKSSFWSRQNVFPGGVNNYNRWRQKMGLLEE
ncbi:MAG: hypothetical protein K2L86_04830 [Lachnospiraceae bacterium]|nr:hypothetical protein [Lachnospiraceae bacterium]